MNLDLDKPRGSSLRDRKRRQTRERITNAAMALFVARGFEATTIDDIAAAADISKRGFFGYFPSKEDVVAAWQDGFGDALATAVAARPRDEPLPIAARNAMIAALSDAATPHSLAIGRLLRDTPALRARDYLKYARLEQVLVDALAARVDEPSLPVRLVAMVTIGVLRLGAQTADFDAPFASIEAQVRAMFDTLWAELHRLGDDATS